MTIRNVRPGFCRAFFVGYCVGEVLLVSVLVVSVLVVSVIVPILLVSPARESAEVWPCLLEEHAEDINTELIKIEKIDTFIIKFLICKALTHNSV